jgi:thioredoxin-like negative regulator of GroEL
MQKNAAAPGKKSQLTNVLMVVFILAVLGTVLWNLPRGYSTDLAQIGKGQNIVVLVHDHYLVNSTHLMENLNPLRTEYAGVVEFMVADLQVPEGQAFAKTHNAEATTLLFFAPDGTPLGRLQGVQETAALRDMLNQLFHLPASGRAANG